MFSDKLKNVANNLDAVHISTTKTQLESVIQEIDNVKPILKEVGNFEQHFKNHMKFVEPVGRPISVRYESRLDKETGKICQYPIPNTYQYIPIHQTIRFVYSYMYDILKKQQSNTNNLISDFSDASRFKECQLFIENSDALQLHLYFDNFETVNPLGSKTKIHKLGAVYMVIQNLPFKLPSHAYSSGMSFLLYWELFPTKRLTPKYHNLVHYPACLQKSGPACRCWCMRFEAKHNQLKKSATSFKNVCKTVALKQQIHQCLTWHLKKKFGGRDVNSGAGELIFVRVLKAASAVCDKLCIGMLDEVYVCRHTMTNGTDYFSGDVLVVGRQMDECLKFIFIDEFILSDGGIYFVCQELHTHYYDSHYHAFAVENDDCGKSVVLEYDELLDYYPLALHTVSGTRSKYSFVALRHAVVTSISK
nr:uncharacterized protein LOC124807994 [Hydra vulgaris]